MTHIHPKDPLVWSERWYETDEVIETFACNGTLRTENGRIFCVEYDTYLRKRKRKTSL